MRNQVMLIAALVLSAPAWATLGESASSIDTDATTLQATTAPTSTQHGTYTVTTFALPFGTVVKEFVNDSSGLVFAVSWRGPRAIHSSMLLGSHDSDYRTKLAQRGRGVRLHHVFVNTGNMVVNRSSYLRDHRGSAYIQSLFPAGVTLANLQ